MSPKRPDVPPLAWAASVGSKEVTTEAVLLGAARALLRAENAEEIVGVVIEAVRDLGAGLDTPSGRRDTELPVDVTFGSGLPLVPCGEPEVLRRLEQVLPALIEDARVALARVHVAEQLVDSATKDPLTGLDNRRLIRRVLGRLHDGDVVVMIDLDHFKAVNDEYGHEAGDAVLRAFGRALRVATRAADGTGRLGGEEFVVLMRDAEVDDGLAMLERLREVWQRMRLGPVTFSAGVAPVGDGESRQALRRADEALYRAKDAGRDRFEVGG